MSLAVLGATGSIGRSTLDVVARHADRFKLFALTAHRSAERLLELCRAHHPHYAVLSGIGADAALERRFAEAGSELLFGAPALDQVVAHDRCTAVMAGIVGAAGLASTLAAVRAGKRVLLANKEALVMAGSLVMQAARDSGALLLPVDSEHNAVFQCFSEKKSIRKIVLTASGGPFRQTSPEKLSGVTPEQACAHPNWVMGRKISVDSATMMNKGLEVIEARWLFDLAPEAIEVVIHPQSIVHSMVEYLDGSVIAQLSNPDMRVPAIKNLSFEEPDLARFPCLELAYAALRAGRSAPTLLNAANEIAVEAFLAGRLGFTGIARVIGETMDELPTGPVGALAEVLAADGKARATAAALVMAQAA